MPKGLRNLIILGVLGWIGYAMLFQQPPGDRPTMVISNGPVRLEVQSESGRGAGDFQKGTFGMGRSWYHHHPDHAPTHFDVTVTDSSCGQEAKYDATEMTVLSGGAGTSSSFTVSIWGVGAMSYLQVDPLGTTQIAHDTINTPHQLNIGGPDEQLQSVMVAGSNCAFTPGGGTITIRQLH